MVHFVRSRRSCTNPKLWDVLRDAFEQEETPEPVLLYQASWDGATTEQFHSHCDQKGATVVFAILEDSAIYGAYVDVPWCTPPDSTVLREDVPNSVLFSYTEADGVRFYPRSGAGFMIRPRVSIKMCASLGPSIGAGPDFEIHFGRSMMLTGTPASYEDANIPLPWADLKDVEVWRL